MNTEKDKQDGSLQNTLKMVNANSEELSKGWNRASNTYLTQISKDMASIGSEFRHNILCDAYSQEICEKFALNANSNNMQTEILDTNSINRNAWDEGQPLSTMQPRKLESLDNMWLMSRKKRRNKDSVDFAAGSHHIRRHTMNNSKSVYDAEVSNNMDSYS